MSDEPHTTEDDFDALSTDELLDRLESWGLGVPLILVNAIVSRGSEAVPRLAAIVSSRRWWNERRHGYNAAVIHAMHLLGLIGDPSAADALLVPMRWDLDSDFLTSSMPGILARLGPGAIPVLRTFVDDPSQDDILRSVVYSGLMGMALLHPELQPQVKLIGRQVALRCMATGEPFPIFIAPELASYRDPADLRLLEQLYNSDLWLDRYAVSWEEVLEAHEQGLPDVEVESAIRDPMDYFMPEEQSRLKKVWAQWEADMQRWEERQRRKKR